MILEKTINRASQILKDHNIRTHQLDAQIILSDIMKVKREILITNNKATISKLVIKRYHSAIQRRIKREPVAYITGKKEFWNDDFIINKSTLVPRPETELVIYKVISFFKNKNINILDIGTGSGCLLLSILKELSFSRGIGIDISSKAIQIARSNSKKLNLLNRVKFKVCDLKKFGFGKYDLIVSNPPYIPSSDLKNLSKDITNYEPLIALNGGIDGLDVIKKIIYKSNYLLKRGGLLAIEIGYKQYQKVSQILTRSGFKEIGKEHDNNFNVRCIISTKVGFF